MLGLFYAVCERHLRVLTHMLSFSYLQDPLLLSGPCRWLQEGCIHRVSSKSTLPHAHLPNSGYRCLFPESLRNGIKTYWQGKGGGPAAWKVWNVGQGRCEGSLRRRRESCTRSGSIRDSKEEWELPVGTHTTGHWWWGTTGTLGWEGTDCPGKDWQNENREDYT